MRRQSGILAPATNKTGTAIAALVVLTFALGAIGPAVWADGPIQPLPPAADDISVKASNLIPLPLPPTQRATAKSRAGFTDPAIATVVDKLGQMEQPAALKQPEPRARIAISASHDKAQSPYLAQAWQAMRSGDGLAALRDADRALADRPDAADALSLKAYILAQMDRHDAAIEILCRLLEQDPANAEALRGLAIELGKSAAPQALKELEDMASADPSSAPVQAALAQQYARNQDETKALTALDSAVRLAPQNLAYRVELASLYDRYGYPSEAAALYRQASETASSRAEYGEGENGPGLTQELVQAIKNRANYLTRSALRARRGAPNAPLPDTSLPDE